MEMAFNKPLHGSRILVVEDEPIIAFEILAALRLAGADVLGPALSLARALELATEEHFDCAVLDVMLRDGSVFPAASVVSRKCLPVSRRALKGICEI
jgi:DNA-binding response OmpR family regulator